MTATSIAQMKKRKTANCRSNTVSRKKKHKRMGVMKGYRSGLEEMIARSLTKRGVKFTFESRKVPFIEPEKRRHYTPDFFLPNGIVIESKGRFLSKDRQKHILVKQQHPNLEIRFVFSRATDPIYKGSNTTCAMWAEKFGFKWAEKEIPDDWIREDSNPKWIEALWDLIPTKKKGK